MKLKIYSHVLVYLKEREFFQPVVLLIRCLQQTGMGQSRTRSQEFLLGFHCECKGSKYWGLHCCLPHALEGL